MKMILNDYYKFLSNNVGRIASDVAKATAGSALGRITAITLLASASLGALCKIASRKLSGLWPAKSSHSIEVRPSSYELCPEIFRGEEAKSYSLGFLRNIAYVLDRVTQQIRDKSYNRVYVKPEDRASFISELDKILKPMNLRAFYIQSRDSLTEVQELASSPNCKGIVLFSNLNSSDFHPGENDIAPLNMKAMQLFLKFSDEPVGESKYKIPYPEIQTRLNFAELLSLIGKKRQDSSSMPVISYTLKNRAELGQIKTYLSKNSLASGAQIKDNIVYTQCNDFLNCSEPFSSASSGPSEDSGLEVEIIEGLIDWAKNDLGLPLGPPENAASRRKASRKIYIINGVHPEDIEKVKSHIDSVTYGRRLPGNSNGVIILCDPDESNHASAIEVTSQQGKNEPESLGSSKAYALLSIVNALESTSEQSQLEDAGADCIESIEPEVIDWASKLPQRDLPQALEKSLKQAITASDNKLSVVDVLGDGNGSLNPIFSKGFRNRSKLNGLKERLNKEIVGQEMAFDRIINAFESHSSIANFMRSEKNSQKPLVLMFPGPTGVGKTETAKQIQKHYGCEMTIIALNKYSERHRTSELYGSPPGYYGPSKGILNDAITKGGIILFDEVEKAAKTVVQSLLNAIDEGYTTDSAGKKYDCSHCLFIFTTNLGGRQIVQSSSPLEYTQQVRDFSRGLSSLSNQQGAPELNGNISPEFVGRTQVVLYCPLSLPSIAELVFREIKRQNSALQRSRANHSFFITQDNMLPLANELRQLGSGARGIIQYLETEIFSALPPNPNNHQVMEIGISTT